MRPGTWKSPGCELREHSSYRPAKRPLALSLTGRKEAPEAECFRSDGYLSQGTQYSEPYSVENQLISQPPALHRIRRPRPNPAENSSPADFVAGFARIRLFASLLNSCESSYG